MRNLKTKKVEYDDAITLTLYVEVAVRGLENWQEQERSNCEKKPRLCTGAKRCDASGQNLTCEN